MHRVCTRKPYAVAKSGVPISYCNVRRKWCRRKELNFRPHPYQGCALPLSYGGTGSRPRPMGAHRLACCAPHLTGARTLPQRRGAPQASLTAEGTPGTIAPGFDPFERCSPGRGNRRRDQALAHERQGRQNGRGHPPPAGRQAPRQPGPAKAPGARARRASGCARTPGSGCLTEPVRPRSPAPYRAGPLSRPSRPSFRPRDRRPSIRDSLPRTGAP